MSGMLNIAKPVTNARRLIVDCMGSPFLRYVNAARKIALYRIGDAPAILVIDGYADVALKAEVEARRVFPARVSSSAASASISFLPVHTGFS